MNDPEVDWVRELGLTNASEAAKWAREGDWEPLLRFIEGGWVITEEMTELRAVLSDIVRGVLRRRKKMKSHETDRRHFHWAFRVTSLMYLEGMTRKDAIGQVAAQNGLRVDQNGECNSINKALRKYRVQMDEVREQWRQEDAPLLHPQATQ